ncbi:MAG: serine protease, partial [bacterium]|nr:serine protease [bacterium]
REGCMNTMKILLALLGLFVLGALGGIWAQSSVMPYLASHNAFQNWRFVQEWNQRTTVIRPTTQIVLTENEARERLVDQVKDAVVGVRAQSGTRVLLGSGFIAYSDGLIVTIADLVPAGFQVSVYLNEEPERAQVLKRDIANNLVLLKIERRNLRTLEFAPGVSAGRSVTLVGKEVGQQDILTSVNYGVVKSIGEEVFKTTMTEKSFLSGAPLFDREGRLAGLAVFEPDRSVNGIPASVLRFFLGF